MRYTIFVKPGSKKGPLVEVGEDGTLTVFVRERAVEGKANAAIAELLAAHFNVPKTAITVVHGHTARHKIIDIID